MQKLCSLINLCGTRSRLVLDDVHEFAKYLHVKRVSMGKIELLKTACLPDASLSCFVLIICCISLVYLQNRFHLVTLGISMRVALFVIISVHCLLSMNF